MGAKFVIAIDWDNQIRMDLAKKLGADSTWQKATMLLNQCYLTPMVRE